MRFFLSYWLEFPEVVKLFATTNNKTSVSPRRQSVLFLSILFVHFLLVTLAFLMKPAQPQIFSKALRLVDVQKQQSRLDITAPLISEVKPDFSRLVPVAPTAVAELENDHVDYSLNLAPGESSYQLPAKNEKLFQDVFDPRLRKRLQENYKVAAKPKLKKYDSFTNVHGATVVALGNGRCMISLPKVDSNDRGTNWAMSSDTCGKTDSQVMMDDIEKDLEEKKHPLNAVE